MSNRIRALLLCVVIAVSLCIQTKAADDFNRISGTHNYVDDVLKSNPHHRESVDFNINCTHAVAAYEMRRRGWDVEATGAKADDTYILHWTTVWGDYDYSKKLNSTDPLKEIEDIILYAGDGARFEVCFSWISKSAQYGHALVGENVDGCVVWLDPQSGKYGDTIRKKFELVDKTKIWYIRIDDLQLNMSKMKELCVNSEIWYNPFVDYMSLINYYVNIGDVDMALEANNLRNAKIAKENLSHKMLTNEEVLKMFFG